MYQSHCMHVFCVVLSALTLGSNANAEGAPASADDLAFFENKIRPILSEHCYNCHGSEKQKGGLRLDHIQTILTGGDTGPALVTGNPAESLIGVAIGYDNVDFQMPPKNRLPEEKRDLLNEWISRGAPWPEEALPEEKGAVEEFDLEKRRADHWAWQPVTDPAPPAANDARFQQNPVDQFLQVKREAQGLETAPKADRRTLARRAHFAITGLPPNPSDVEYFLNDTRPDAYERLLDGLLNDAAFGERWGRHWFDLVRYAETHGHEGDYPIRHAWTYRDYVIRALNNDVPYDQFVREHIAGDLLESPRRHPEEGYNESILATGFWFMHQATHAPVDVQKDQADRIDNQLDVMSKAFLGMTVACARCHDHKFDAISARDYYAMAGHLYSARQSIAFLDPGNRIESATTTRRALLRKQRRDIEAEIRGVPSLANQPIAPYLEAAAKVIHDEPKPSDAVPEPAPDRKKRPKVGRPVEAVAAELGLDANILARWRNALTEPNVGSPSHPLHLWSRLAKESRTARTKDFLALARELGASSATPVPPQADPSNVTFARFDDGTFEGWFPTGEAFGKAPSRNAWHDASGELVPVPDGTAHSGLLSGRLQGILRSPSFTIDSNFVHVRLAARNARVRMVIDGYQLRYDNGLLFGDTLIETGDTGGVFTWRTMGRQVGKYRGRRAYFELVDESDGYIAVDEIVFSEVPTPPTDAASPLSGLVSDEITIKGMMLSDVALRYEALFRDAWQQGQEDPTKLADDPLTALLLRRGLWWTMEARPRRDAMRAALRDSNNPIAEPRKALVMAAGSSENGAYFIRGDHRNPDGEVPRAFLTALTEDGLSDAPDRLDLARKTASARNPLTARVYVNRVWHHLFGRGIVPSVDNFGALGQEPSHPELLDYLAVRFVEDGWSTKRLIKALMLTETYRMSSVPIAPDTEAKDPANILLHRMPVQRLEGEIIRDSLLALGGNLDTTMYGPPVPAYIPPFERNRRSPGHSGPIDGNRRRTVYLEVRRNHLLSMATAFDMPVPDTTIGGRTVSNLPAQALIMMNDPFVVDQARIWSERLLDEAPETFVALTESLYESALARAPRPDERDTLAAFVAAQAALYSVPSEDAWRDSRILADLCHTVFMLKEFIYVG
jgi:hypothetical protein